MEKLQIRKVAQGVLPRWPTLKIKGWNVRVGLASGPSARIKDMATSPVPTSFLNYFVCRVLCGSLQIHVGLPWLVYIPLYDYRLDQYWVHLQCFQKAPLTLAISLPHSQVT